MHAKNRGMNERELVVVSVLLLLLAPCRVQCSFTACPVNSQEFLSVNRELLPIGNVWATSEDTAFNPIENLITRNSQVSPPWCSEPDVPTISEQYVEINYTETVVITLLKSSGFFNGYVNNFTIEYGSLEGELQVYSVNNHPQDFLIESLLETDVYFTLEQPIVAQRLRFRINDALLDPSNRICWKLLMYGCRLSDGVVINAEPSKTTPLTESVTTTPTQESTTSSECPPAVGITDDSIGSTSGDQELLLIVLPVALATIIIVLVIMVVGVLVCITCTGRKMKNSNYESVTVHMLNNRTKELTRQGSAVANGGSETPKSSMSFHYDSPRILSYDVPRLSTRSRPTSEGGSSDMLSGTFEIKNPLYSLKRRQSKQEPPAVFIPDEGNDYEMIPEPVTSDVAHSTRHTSLPPYCNGKERSPDPPPSLPLRTHTYSMVKKKRERAATESSIHSSTQDLGERRESKERVNESIYNRLSKVAGSDPMFQVVYDEPCNEDPDIDSSVV